jgi:hypothetical protein
VALIERSDVYVLDDLDDCPQAIMWSDRRFEQSSRIGFVVCRDASASMGEAWSFFRNKVGRHAQFEPD